MIKINAKMTNNLSSQNAQDSRSDRLSATNLLGQQIPDTVSFSGSEKKDKKNNTLAWVLGLGAVATGVYFLVKKKNVKPLEDAVKEVGNKEASAAKYSGGSGGSLSNKYSSSAPIKDFDLEKTLTFDGLKNAKFKTDFDKLHEDRQHMYMTLTKNYNHDGALKAAELRKANFVNDFNKLHNDRQAMYSNLTKDYDHTKALIKARAEKIIPENDIKNLDFDHPADSINMLAQNKNVKYSAELLEDTYNYLKTAKITDSVEKEKALNSRIFVLNQLKSIHAGNRDMKKVREVKNLINHEVNVLIENHFGKGFANTTFSNAYKADLGREIKKIANMNMATLQKQGAKTYEMFPCLLSLSSASIVGKNITSLDKLAENVNVKSYKAFYDSVLKDFAATESINNKSVEILESMNIKNGFANSTIQELKEGLNVAKPYLDKFKNILDAIPPELENEATSETFKDFALKNKETIFKDKLTPEEIEQFFK